MFCSKCGQQIPDGVKFCPACGTPVVTRTMGDPNAIGKGFTSENGQPVPTAKKKHGPFKVIITIVVIVAIVLAGGVFGYRYYSKMQNEQAAKVTDEFMSALQNGDLDVATGYCSDSSVLESIPNYGSMMSDVLDSTNAYIGLSDGDLSDETKQAMEACVKDFAKCMFKDYSCKDPTLDWTCRNGSVEASIKINAADGSAESVFSDIDNDMYDSWYDLEGRLYDIYYQQGDKTQACIDLLDELLKAGYQSIDKGVQKMANSEGQETVKARVTLELEKKDNTFEIVSIRSKDLEEQSESLKEAMQETIDGQKEDVASDGTMLDQLLDMMKK